MAVTAMGSARVRASVESTSTVTGLTPIHG